jgi:hypothetical protein
LKPVAFFVGSRHGWRGLDRGSDPLVDPLNDLG